MITLLAPAKVNLCLRVYGKIDSGLHNLDSIVVFCQFGDKVSISPADHDSFLERGPFAPSVTATGTRKNLVIAARDAFRVNGGVCGPIAIILDKEIPIGSGLGGASADAASRALRRSSAPRANALYSSVQGKDANPVGGSGSASHAASTSSAPRDPGAASKSSGSAAAGPSGRSCPQPMRWPSDSATSKQSTLIDSGFMRFFAIVVAIGTRSPNEPRRKSRHCAGCSRSSSVAATVFMLC